MRNRVIASFWGIIILVFCFISGWSLLTPGTIQFDILTLLPEHHSPATQAAHQFMKDTNLSRQVVILVGHKDPSQAQKALHCLKNNLKSLSLPLEEIKTSAIAQSYQAIFQTLYPYRQGLLSPQDRQELLKAPLNNDYFIQRSLSQFTTPFAIVSPTQLQEDPFFLFYHYIQATSPSFSFTLDNNGEVTFLDQEKTWYLFKAHLQDSAFSLKVQEDLCSVLLPILHDIEQTYQVKIVKTGTLFYAAQGAQQAQGEISFISTLSLVGIIILLLGIFRTGRPLLLAGIVIGTGILGGLAVCLWICKSIHILALVFGCSLVGVTVDYAIHYFCASYTPDTSDSQRQGSIGNPMKKLMPAILFSLFSSAIGYGLLFFVPFPGIQQMAILASMGLISAFLTVYCWGPFLIRPKTSIPSQALFLQDKLEKFAAYGKNQKVRMAISGSLILLFGGGLLKLTFDDNIQNFQAVNPSLRQEEEIIRSLLPIDQSGKFILIAGKSTEDLLQTQEKLIPLLDSLQHNKDIKNYRCLAHLVPSEQRQQENQHLQRTKLYTTPLKTLLQTLNLPLTINVEEKPTVSLSSLINYLPEGWKELFHISSHEIQGRIFLNQITDDTGLQQICALPEMTGVTYIDVVQEYNQIFKQYRQIVLSLIGCILFGIFLTLLCQKNFITACHVMYPVSLSLVSTIGIISLFGIPITLFHTMGLLLVLCIGIDYGFFLFWRKPIHQASSQEKSDLLLLGNALAALTTILSFGLLSLSQTTAVHSFGLTVFIGIALNFMLTTLFIGNRESSYEL